MESGTSSRRSLSFLKGSLAQPAPFGAGVWSPALPHLALCLLLALQGNLDGLWEVSALLVLQAGRWVSTCALWESNLCSAQRREMSGAGLSLLK